jgi:hypothetical protein
MSADARWTEDSSLQALAETLSKIKRRNLSGALDTIIYLNFEQILRPVKNQNTLQVVDLGSSFGVERVRETGDWIRSCEIALRNSDAGEAQTAAEAALARWQQK